ncbi:hypothetical protein GDO81_028877 [Engystomops pustulosus]|uniref:Taste receptor type 2 n=1 Tax=Engystomops pustulosus TaxID=76066 RepID=A0AAV6ZRM7_ENGPU|nr:hypothetical protein GDO81_028877 [Engystomops pustulosus]
MEFTLKKILILLLYCECFAGITVNLIILAANIMKWKTLKSLSTSDKILNCLVTSRTLLVFNISLASYLYQFHPWIFHDIVVTAAMLTYGVILHYTDLWFATVLCVFYCVKITSYSWKFFIFLKTKISTLVPWFLLGSLIASIFSSLPYGFNFYDMKHQDLSNVSSKPMIFYRAGTIQNFYNQALITLLGSCPPFIIFLLAIFLLLHSLLMHTRRMRSSEYGFHTPNLKGHFSAVRSMSVFLVLQIIHFIFINLLFFGILYDVGVFYWLNLIITCALPFLHSLYMICFCGEIKKTITSLCRALSTCE